MFFVAGPAGPVASTAVLAGSIVVDKAGQLGKVLFNSKTFLRTQIELRFDTPGFFAVEPGAIFAFDNKDRGEFAGFKPTLVDGATPQQHMVLRNEAGQDYAGRAPYIILNLDGRRRENLADFKARAATSAILEQFVGSPDAGSQAVAILEEAMGLLNDATFREKALATQTQLNAVNQEIQVLKNKKTDPTSDEFKKKTALQNALQARLKAFNGNIRQELFKLNS